MKIASNKIQQYSSMIFFLFLKTDFGQKSTKLNYLSMVP